MQRPLHLPCTKQLPWIVGDQSPLNAVCSPRAPALWAVDYKTSKQAPANQLWHWHCFDAHNESCLVLIQNAGLPFFFSSVFLFVGLISRLQEYIYVDRPTGMTQAGPRHINIYAIGHLQILQIVPNYSRVLQRSLRSRKQQECICERDPPFGKITFRIFISHRATSIPFCQNVYIHSTNVRTTIY